MLRLAVCFSFVASIHAADWPMWRHDAGRTAATSQAMPEKLDLLWSRELPPLRPAFREQRLQFDRGYEPVAAGKRLIVASSREDGITAFDTETGAELWRAGADGPVRFAPVIAGGRVIYGSDDGVLRCVRLADGSPLWSKRAVPSGRMLLGNQRMISVWPIRGGPVERDGRVWFAAGVWPLEGVFVFCWDAATGDEIWCNDRCSFIYGTQPHAAEALGGLAPQGYLLIDGDDLVVPCSTAYPARLDLKTGALKEFELPSAGRLTGGWFAATPAEREAAKLKRRGLLFDSAVSAKRHEDKPRAEGLPGIQRSLRAADREWSFDQMNFPGITGRIHSVIVADGKGFVTTEDGMLRAYGAAKSAAKHWKREIVIEQADEELAKKCIAAAGTDRGYALLATPGKAGFIESLLTLSLYHLIVLCDDESVKARLVKAGLHGERVAVLPSKTGLPPYFASVVFSDEPLGNVLRPHGGRLVSALTGELLHTRGPLDGSKNYLADWNANNDPLVKAPLGVLWFDDALSHFKRSPQPKIADGVMISSDKDWLDASTRKGKVDYRLLAPLFSDIYTGRLLDEYEAPELRKKFGAVDQETIQQAQYRPPSQKNDWAPESPEAGRRINPLTGEQEPRTFPKSYGCDGGFDYGGIFTFRSGTAAFYDKRIESGTIHISGPRSGCTNSIVPAGGILNVPYFFEGCTCSYPLPTALALTSMPETFEQWASWGAVPAASLRGKIERLGINFGAPGDRKTEDGTLWLDHPGIGGPSPEIELQTEPEKTEFFYRHSVWMKGGQGWPWVAASGVKAARSIVLSGLRRGEYSVRLVFAAPDKLKRSFDVSLQGKLALERVQPEEMIARTETIPSVIIADGSLKVDFTVHEGEPLLCGMEIIRDGLKIGSMPSSLNRADWR